MIVPVWGFSAPGSLEWGPVAALLASTEARGPLRSEPPPCATGPTLCDGPRHKTARPPGPRGSFRSMSRRPTPSSVRAAAALAGVARRCGADSKSWNAPSPIPALRAPRRRVFPRRAKRRGSWLRPPPGQRACGLQAVDFFTQQLVAHAQIGDQGFQPLGLFVLHIGFPRSQVGFAAVQKLIPPAGQGRGGYPPFPREGFQILAPQQPPDRCRLAFGRPASPPSRRSSGAPPVALRAPCGAPEVGSLSLLTDTSM